MSKIGPIPTAVDVQIGECPACRKPIVAVVAATVTVTATGRAPTADDSAVVSLSAGPIKVEYARVAHDCGPQDEQIEGKS